MSRLEQRLHNWAICSVVINEYIFTTNRIMNSRTSAAPAVNNSFNTVVSGVYVLALADPVMMNVQDNRNNIRNAKTIIIGDSKTRPIALPVTSTKRFKLKRQPRRAVSRTVSSGKPPKIGRAHV